MKKKSCPVCGSKEISLKKKKKVIKDRLGGEETVSVNIYSCPVCGTTGDLFKENVQVIRKAFLSLNEKAAKNSIDFLIKQGHSLSFIERVLGLSQRTLTKWKIGATKPSAPGVTLLRFLEIFPKLLDVAENNFDKDIAKMILLEEVANQAVEYDEIFTAASKDEFFLYIKKSVKVNKNKSSNCFDNEIQLAIEAQ